MELSSNGFGLFATSLRFAPASALLIYHSVSVQSPEPESLEKDLMGSFSNLIGAVMARFGNCCRVKRVQGVRVCVATKISISDRIIPTLLSFTERAALVKGHVICIGSLRWLRSIAFITCTS